MNISHHVMTTWLLCASIQATLVTTFSFVPNQGQGVTWSKNSRRGPSSNLLQASVNGNTVSEKETTGPSTPVATQTEPEETDQTFLWARQWYPVIPLSYLEGMDDTKPISMTILNQDLVIWKSSSPNTSNSSETSTNDATNTETTSSSSSYSILQDTCPHRRAPLSTGKVVQDKDTGEQTLACRYHGWEFSEKGTCTKIPMQCDGQKGGQRVRVPSYHTQQIGGLLWAFMDPTVAKEDLPEIPQDALLTQDEMENAIWIYNRNPVSYNSMIENSFDPSHAPFTHEGFKPPFGQPYSPHTAIPMQRYELTEPLSPTGFTLRHTPYAQYPGYESANATNTPLTDRTFIAPCTTLVKSPGLQARLYFVPSTPTSSTTLAYFRLPSPKNTLFSKVQKRIIPSSWKRFMETWFHVYFNNGLSTTKFALQDQLTMQGQDRRKFQDSSKGWNRDMVVSPSDAGVSALQKWMRTFAMGGPFAEAPTTSSMDPTRINPRYLQEHPVLSRWEVHGKYCPTCQAALRQVNTWNGRLQRISGLSMAMSLGSVMFSLVRSIIIHMTRQQPSSGTAMGVMLSSNTMAMSCLVVSVVAKALASKCAQIRDSFFAVGHHELQKDQTNVYQYNN